MWINCTDGTVFYVFRCGSIVRTVLLFYVFRCRSIVRAILLFTCSDVDQLYGCTAVLRVPMWINCTDGTAVLRVPMWINCTDGIADLRIPMWINCTDGTAVLRVPMCDAGGTAFFYMLRCVMRAVLLFKVFRCGSFVRTILLFTSRPVLRPLWPTGSCDGQWRRWRWRLVPAPWGWCPDD